MEVNKYVCMGGRHPARARTSTSHGPKQGQRTDRRTDGDMPRRKAALDSRSFEESHGRSCRVARRDLSARRPVPREAPFPCAPPRPDSCRRPACVSVRLKSCAWTPGPRRQAGSTVQPGGHATVQGGRVLGLRPLRPVPVELYCLLALPSRSRIGWTQGICTLAAGACLTPRSQPALLHLQGRFHAMCLRCRHRRGLVTAFGQRGGPPLPTCDRPCTRNALLRAR